MTNYLGYIFIGVVVLIGIVLIWKHFVKPYQLKHDSTICFIGGLGSGKTLLSSKIAIKHYKSVHRSWRFECWRNHIHNWACEHNLLFRNVKKVDAEEPQIYSNIPLIVRFFPKKVYSRVLKVDHIILKKRIEEHSVVFIDEFQQFINQFSWNEDAVKGVCNEYITFFRHYIDGLLIVNTQADDQIVKDWRVKLTCFYRCIDHSHYFGFFYRIGLLRQAVGDLDVSLTSDFIDDNCKYHYGLYFPRRYDSRCYRHRYDKLTDVSKEQFKELTTNKVLRFVNGYTSPLDDKEGK